MVPIIWVLLSYIEYLDFGGPIRKFTVVEHFRLIVLRAYAPDAFELSVIRHHPHRRRRGHFPTKKGATHRVSCDKGPATSLPIQIGLVAAGRSLGQWPGSVDLRGMPNNNMISLRTYFRPLRRNNTYLGSYMEISDSPL